jgi:hypothetical protein
MIEDLAGIVELRGGTTIVVGLHNNLYGTSMAHYTASCLLSFSTFNQYPSHALESMPLRQFLSGGIEASAI